MNENFKTTIGLEIHVELKTKSKMFCDCQNPAALKDDIAEREPNQFTCPICMGFPGVLPVANQQAIDWTILTGLALNCQIPEVAKFDRKHYFYPDLPKGFQISQYDRPFARHGELKLKSQNEKLKIIRIRRVHLEEDAGKLIHPKGKNFSLVDLNRAGTPLMEIVTEPDLESPAEAKMFIQKLRQILRYLSVSDANMEKGHLRCDANIDVKKIQNSKLKSQKSGNPILNNSKIHNLKPITYSMSPIVEIKNLNSFKFIEKALLYEEQRLTDDFENWPEKPIKLTRGFDSKSGQTYQQRTKEEASDYRYFPEPDLPPFKFSASQIGKIRETLPELPDQRVARYLHDYKINQHDAENLASDVRLAEYFEEVVAEKVSAQKAANWILTELLGKINKSGEDFTENKIKPADFAQLINKIETGEISGKMAKEILEIMFKSGKSAEKVICELNLKVISKDEELEEIAGDVIKNNPKVAEDFKSGKTQALQFLVGQIMRQTQGRANPTKIAEILTKKLK